MSVWVGISPARWSSNRVGTPEARLEHCLALAERGLACDPPPQPSLRSPVTHARVIGRASGACRRQCNPGSEGKTRSIPHGRHVVWQREAEVVTHQLKILQIRPLGPWLASALASLLVASPEWPTDRLPMSHPSAMLAPPRMKKVARVFASFEESDEADARFYASLRPEQRVEILLDLVARYRESLSEAATRFERVCRVVELHRS